MNFTSFEQYFESQSRRLCADLRLSADYPGMVRGLYFASECFVIVEFEQYGWEEGGAYFYGQYPDYANAVRSIEHYLGKSLTDLSNADGAYPDHPGIVHINVGAGMLADAIATNTVSLPDGARFELRGSWQWKTRLSKEQ